MKSRLPKILLTAVVVFWACLVSAQTTITGTVFDNNHKPLMGASIAVDGTDIMTLTKSDGSYSVTVPDEYAYNPLIVRYVGYKPKYIFSKVGSHERCGV